MKSPFLILTFLLLAALNHTAPAIAASSTTTPPTISLFLLDTSPQPLDASIISYTALPTPATTLLINCPAGEDGDICGYAPGATVALQGTSLYDFSISEGDDFSGSVHCEIVASVTYVCTESYGGAEANFPGVSTVTYQGADVSFYPVTVTAGWEKITDGGGGGVTSTTASSSTASQGATGTVAATTTSTMAASTSSDVVATSFPNGTPSSNAGTTTSSPVASGAETQSATTSVAQSTGAGSRAVQVGNSAGLGALIGAIYAQIYL